MLKRALRAAAVLLLVCPAASMAAGPAAPVTQDRGEELRSLRLDSDKLPPAGTVRLVTLLMEDAAAASGSEQVNAIRREALKHFDKGMGRGNFERLDLLHSLALDTFIHEMFSRDQYRYDVLVSSGFGDYLKSNPSYAAVHQRCQGFERQFETAPELAAELLVGCVWRAAYIPAPAVLQRLVTLPAPRPEGTRPYLAAEYLVLQHSDRSDPSWPFDYRDRARNLRTILLALRGPGLKVDPRQPWERALTENGCYKQSLGRPSLPAGTDDFLEKCFADAATRIQALQVAEIFPAWKYLGPRERTRVEASFAFDRDHVVNEARKEARLAEIRRIKAPHFEQQEKEEAQRQAAADAEAERRWKRIMEMPAVDSDQADNKRDAARAERERMEASKESYRILMQNGGGASDTAGRTSGSANERSGNSPDLWLTRMPDETADYKRSEAERKKAIADGERMKAYQERIERAWEKEAAGRGKVGPGNGKLAPRGSGVTR